jgi:hypothetical protein
MSQACAALSDFDFSSDNFSSSEEDEKVKCKKGDLPAFASWANLQETPSTLIPM